MAMARRTTADDSDGVRDLPAAFGIDAQLSEASGVSCSVEVASSSTVNINLQGCNVQTLPITITESPRRSTTENKYRIPSFHKQYVHRSSFESVIEQWLANARAPAMLRLCGQGSAGKTVLASWAAQKAACLGYSTLWLKAEVCQSEDSALEKACEQLLNLHPELTTQEDRCLLVLDGVVDDRIISQLEEVNFLLITTRDKTIGDESRFSEDLKATSVGGLTGDETDQLVEAIVTKDAFELLSKEERLSKVRDICLQFDNFPLSVQLISVRLSFDYKVWRRKSFDDYVEQLQEELKATRQKLSETAKRKGIAAYTGYRFGNTHAAIFWSVQQLAEEEKKKYQFLSIFRRSESFRWQTVSVMWEATEIGTEDQLRSFCDLHLLTEVNDDGGEYTLHDLVYDVVQIWTQDDRNELDTLVVQRYKSKAVVNEQAVKFESIPDEDVWFYRRIVGVCVNAERVDTAVEIFFTYCYLSSRIGLGYSDGILQDMKVLSERRPAVKSWKKIIEVCLARNEKSREKALECMLCQALEWPHDDPAYRKARDTVKAGALPDRPFLSYKLSPRFRSSPTVHFYRTLSGLPLNDGDYMSGASRVAVNPASNLVAAAGNNSLYFFNSTNDRVEREIVIGYRVFYVAWIDNAHCLFITEDPGSGLMLPNTIFTTTGGPARKWVYRCGIIRRQTSGEVTRILNTELVKVGCRALLEYSGGYLWTYTISNEMLRCFIVTPSKICFKRKTSICCEKSSTRLSVSPSGRICVVNKFGNSSTLHIVNVDKEEPRQVSCKKNNVKVVSLHSEYRMLLLLGSVGGNNDTFLMYDLHRRKKEILARIPTPTGRVRMNHFMNGDSLIFQDDSGLHRFSLNSRLCENLNVNGVRIFGHVMATWSPRGVMGLFDLRQVEKSQLVFPTGYTKWGIEESYLLFIEWRDEVKDFVAVSLKKMFGCCFYRVQLLMRLDILLTIPWQNINKVGSVESVTFIGMNFDVKPNTAGSIGRPLSPPGLSVHGSCIAIIVESGVAEFDWGAGKKRWSVSMAGVTAVGHTDDGHGVWAATEGRLVLIVNGRQQRCVEVESAVVCRLFVLGEVCLCEEERFTFFEGGLSAWRGGRRLLPRKICKMYSVSRRGRLCALLTTEGQLLIWRLDSGKESLLSDGYEYVHDLSVSGDGDKCFVLTEGLLTVFYINSGKRQTVAINECFIAHIVALSSSNPIVVLSSWWEVHLVNYQLGRSMLLTPRNFIQRICMNSNSDVGVLWAYMYDGFLVDILQKDRSPFTLNGL